MSFTSKIGSLASRAYGWSAAVARAVDQYFEYVTLLLPGNGTNGAQNNTFLDGSTNNFTITRNGNTTQGTFSPFSQTGWGNYTAGSVSGASRIDVAGTSGLFGTNVSYTIEGWFNFITPSVTDNTNIIATNTNTYPSRWVIDANVTSSLINLRIITESNAILYSGSTVSYSLGSWVHLAIVNDNAANTLTFYINGQAAGTRAKVSLGSYATLNLLNQYGVASAVPFYASNFRITNGQALYSTNFTPSTVPLTTTSQGATAGNVALLTFQSNRFVDNSSSPKTLTVNGSNSIVAFSPFNPTASWSAATYGGSGYFDGSGDYLTATNNAAYDFGTGNFTVETWVYITSYTGGATDVIISNYQNSTNGWTLGIFGTTGKFYFAIAGDSGQIDDTAALPLNQWVHLAAVRSSTTMSLFVNGTRAATTTNSTNNTSTSVLTIGTNVGGGALNFNGYLSNTRVVKGTAVYDPTQTTLTVPTAPLTAITNTSLLLNFTNAGIYDATSKNDLETVGDAKISTAQSKWGGSSMSFDGTGDWLLSNASTDLYAFGTGDFTIEFWLRHNNTGTQIILYDSRPATTNGLYPTIYKSSGNVLVFYTNSADRITGATSLSANTWYHVALSRSGTSTRLFLDGNQQGSTYTDSNNYINPTARPLIGGDGYNVSSSFNGYMQDVRITKGYARYTANFTAPTAAFPTL